MLGKHKKPVTKESTMSLLKIMRGAIIGQKMALDDSIKMAEKQLQALAEIANRITEVNFDDEQAAIVKQTMTDQQTHEVNKLIVKLRDEHQKSFSSISHIINAHGYRNRRGHPFTPTSAKNRYHALIDTQVDNN